ncbi:MULTISPECIES: sigma-70 family RNA polymerase sigma factor [Virgibacillus]|uniref:sigma-70 family RNA polymerase sigma factor n=1 Tax=Virgibacillus TaxID=84406 RepID=UPI000EF47B4D|nr:sigma-70 family RNA polymerase sigma factor [Virgibacillus sp. Bac332]
MQEFSTNKLFNLDEFKAIYSNSLQNPLIQSFLDNNDHLSILNQYISNPTQENKDSLDRAFQEFYTKVKMINYFSKTLYWEAINFDKKIRSSKSRFMPILDGTTSEDNIIPKHRSNEKNVEEQVIESYDLPLVERIENPSLRKGIEKLTNRQKEVLQHIYGYKNSTNETASELKITQQGVSKIHKSAIARLRKEMFKEKGK